MIMAAVGIIISVLLGLCMVSLLWPSNLPRLLALVFAPAVGIGLCSLIFIAFRRPMFLVESGLLLVLAVACIYYRRWRFEPLMWRPIGVWRVPAVFLLLVCAAGMALSYDMSRIERSPHGDWDATAIWNSHARYLFRDGPVWRKTILNTYHADYPLLVPATTARLWRYMKDEDPDAAEALGILYTFAAIAVLTATLIHLRKSSRAVLFALVLLGTPFYVAYGVSGSADVPLSLYVLATIALICLESQAAPESAGLLVLAGFAAGCAGWTKNEGLLFIVAAALAMLAPVFWEPRKTALRFFAFAAGMALPLAMIVWFKVAVAPPNDIVDGNYAGMLQRLLTPHRYVITWTTISDTFWSFGNWLVNPILLILIYVALQGLDRKILLDRGWLQGVFICTVVLAGYTATYLITPMDLQWHLDSSLPRLYLHLWPSFLLLCGLAGPRDPFTTFQPG
ncbi:MAG TPA: hypothetical protein VGK48_04710 [Terriglobia bacterium]|jgi:hypothetical protein